MSPWEGCSASSNLLTCCRFELVDFVEFIDLFRIDWSDKRHRVYHYVCSGPQPEGNQAIAPPQNFQNHVRYSKSYNHSHQKYQLVAALCLFQIIWACGTLKEIDLLWRINAFAFCRIADCCRWKYSKLDVRLKMLTLRFEFWQVRGQLWLKV